jgi:putative exosortase-associated protein (TIGR04073 family)
MKKSFTLAVIMAFVFFAGAAYAGDNGPVTKLGRGIANMATCPLEIIAGIKRSTDEDGGLLAGVTVGLLKGTINTVKRAVVGVYETASFPIPSYDPIITDPVFFFGEELDIFKPTPQ